MHGKDAMVTITMKTPATPLDPLHGLASERETTHDFERRALEAEQALARYRTLFDSIDEAYCIVRVVFDDTGKPLDYIFEEVNQAFERQTDIQNPVGRSMRDIAPNHEPHWVDAYGRIAITGQPERFVSLAKALHRWYDVYAFRIGQPNERRLAILFRDITKRVLTEAALRESEERFRNMANHSPVMIWVTEPDGTCSFLSKSWYDFTGQTPATGLGLGWLGAVHPDDHVYAHEAFVAANARRKAFRAEYRLRYKDGEYRWVIDSAGPRFGTDGQFLGYIGSVMDISDRRRAEEQLRASEKRLRTIIEQLPAGVGVVDPTGTWVLRNSLMERYVPQAVPAIAPERAAQWRAWDEQGSTIPLEDWPSRRALRGETVMPGLEMRYTDDAQGELWMRVSAAPLRDDFGEVIGACSVVQDVTQLKNAEHALREADRRKDEFLAILAHELRNPLAPIRNSVHILRLAAGDTVAAARVHEMLERQVNHMARLVDDLMEVSRITRGKVELRKEPVDLGAVLRNAVETSRPLIDAANHRLVVSLPGEPLTLQADPIRLAQVIANLLNNAAKYTHEGGGIGLTAHGEGSTAVISVRDNGMGIPSTMLPKVFDLFAQVDRTYDRAQGGLGIGLTLVRSLVEMHGGTVEAWSEGPGKGSEFVVRLPLADAQFGPKDHPTQKALTLMPHRILVVDDNQDSADSLGMLLKLLGAEVYTVHDGPAALEALKTHRPDVVLLDIGMPGMDGYELAREARRRPEGRDVTLIALTGWGQDEDRRRSRDAGIDHHLVKPVDVGTLEQLLSELASGRPAQVG
jgi:PAS domain S-box-containing protein